MKLFSRSRKSPDDTPSYSVAMGAYYFAPGWPPLTDWNDDLQKLRDNGLSFVHATAAWSCIATAPDTHDWDALDAFISTAHTYSLNVHIALLLESAPEWIIQAHPEWLYVNNDGKLLHPYARSRFPFGGWPGVCFENDGARDAALPFITGVADRASTADNVTAIEAWTGVALPPSFHKRLKDDRYCYCPATQKYFIEWLKKTYNDDLDTLNRQWMRHYTQWDHVSPPRWYTSFPDNMDWLRFLTQRQEELLQWRCDTLRSAGYKGTISAHTGLTHPLYPELACDAHACARHVDAWGFTNERVYEGKEHAFRLFFGADLARSAAREKPLHLSQLRIGPFASRSLQREAGHSAAFVRLNTCAAFAGGASEITYRAWRPQITGHEADGYGLTTIDGTLNSRTETVASFEALLEKHQDIPPLAVPSADVGILHLPDAARLNCVAEGGDTTYYRQSLLGTYQALFEHNITADIIRHDQLDGYSLVYMPWPLALSREEAESIKLFVEKGGTLVSEASPGRYSTHGLRSYVVPSHGLDDVFGCHEKGVAEFIPPGEKAPSISGLKSHYPCANIQAFLTTTHGAAVGEYLTGEIAIVDATYGKGKTRLIATSPSIAYASKKDTRAADLICSSLTYAGISPRITTDATAVHVRLLTGESCELIIIVNMTNVPAHVSLDNVLNNTSFSTLHDWMDGSTHKMRKAPTSFTVKSHDMYIVELRS